MLSPRKNRLQLFYVLIFLITPFLLIAGTDPLTVYLTWQRSPESTMTVHWITPSQEASDTVYYQAVGQQNWQEITGNHRPLPEGHTEYFVHTAEITQLQPATQYRFRTGQQASPLTFRTMPAVLCTPIRFVVGGDMYHDLLEVLENTNRQAARFDPMFVLAGGDLAYASPKDPKMPENAQRWLEFLIAWKKTMVTSQGDLIPIIPSTSNEDTKGRYGQPTSNAAFFYALFAMPGEQGYQVLDFSNYMSVWILDSGHTHPIHGEQDSWLEKTLAQRGSIPHKFALYHVPAYPSVREYFDGMSPEIRRYWVPLFEKYAINVAFEHHDHAYKRTPPIKQEHPDPKGVVYIGDGGWGVRVPRHPRGNEPRWYIAKSAPKRNFIVATINPDGSRHFKAVDDKGEVIDELTQSCDQVSLEKLNSRS